jgi:type III secretory pathway component EscS
MQESLKHILKLLAIMIAIFFTGHFIDIYAFLGSTFTFQILIDNKKGAVIL